MTDLFEIKVWAQMFFDDGSVSQGVRISADVFDKPDLVQETQEKLLKGVNRTEGLMVIWGAGSISVYSVQETPRHGIISFQA